MLEPFQFTAGPRDARIMLCGEAFGKSEHEHQAPFVGESGKELFRMLGEAWPDVAPRELETAKAAFRSDNIWIQLREDWLAKAQVLLTNVFPFRPDEKNNIEALCGKKAEVGAGYTLPPLRQGKYIKPEFLPHVARLKAEILTCKPNLVIALGNTPCWALLGSTRISSIRGVATDSTLCPGVKVIPTFHPASVLRNWPQRPIVIVDLIKAQREGAFPHIIRPEREVIINPTIEDIGHWFNRPAQLYSVDIETGAKQIKCIGFARSRADAIVIPFVDLARPGGNYWASQQAELVAWQYVKSALEGPIAKLFQNGLYDLQYLLRMGFRPANCVHDTMLLHHSIHPEMQKGLGFMGSYLTNEASWKLMNRTDTTATKRDE